MNVFSVTLNWTIADGTTKAVRFTCTKAQVISQITAALNNDVAPTFAQNCSIDVQDLGPIRGPVA